MYGSQILKKSWAFTPQQLKLCPFQRSKMLVTEPISVDYSALTTFLCTQLRIVYMLRHSSGNVPSGVWRIHWHRSDIQRHTTNTWRSCVRCPKPQKMPPDGKHLRTPQQAQCSAPLPPHRFREGIWRHIANTQQHIHCKRECTLTVLD